MNAEEDPTVPGFAGRNAGTTLGVIVAGVLGFTLQPMLAIADPVALLIDGLLLVTAAIFIVAAFATGIQSEIEGHLAGIVVISAIVAMAVTAGDAWQEQRKVEATCSRLQQIMLYEHRHRKDVPEIFRSLGCKAQG